LLISDEKKTTFNQGLSEKPTVQYHPVVVTIKAPTLTVPYIKFHEMLKNDN
jgi:hypothetical protein